MEIVRHRQCCVLSFDKYPTEPPLHFKCPCPWSHSVTSSSYHHHWTIFWKPMRWPHKQIPAPDQYIQFTLLGIDGPTWAIKKALQTANRTQVNWWTRSLHHDLDQVNDRCMARNNQWGGYCCCWKVERENEGKELPKNKQGRMWTSQQKRSCTKNERPIAL